MATKEKWDYFNKYSPRFYRLKKKQDSSTSVAGDVRKIIPGTKLNPSPSPLVQSAKYPAGYIYANLRTACGNRLLNVFVVAYRSLEFS